MAYQGQRYEADDFGYPGSRHGNRDQHQKPPRDDRRYDDDGHNDVGRQNRNYDDDRRRDARDDKGRDDRGGRGDDRLGRADDGGGRSDEPRGGGKQVKKEVVDKCMVDLRRICKARGVAGIKTMGRMFRLYDNNRNGTLTREEFSEGLRDYGLSLTRDEYRHMFDFFDTDNNGTVNYNEFLLHLRPPMSRARIDLIEKAFAKLDRTGDGFVTVDDLKHLYNVTHHPKFKSGEWTRKQVLEEYLQSFQIGPNAEKDNKVTKQEFVEYYAGVSASIDKDVYFDYMMRQAWSI